MRGSFLFLDQTKENKFGGGENEKREKKGRKKNERKTKGMREKNQLVGKEGKWENKGKERREKIIENESRSCILRFPVFRRSEVDKPRIKICLLDESCK